MALLLATSGSTGSPKTVRLSCSGLADNTASVIRALGITAAERAPTTLPITHAYGLSVLNTHLLAGAGIVLGDRPPLSLAAWDHLLRCGATSFAAVQTTYAAFGPAHVNLLGRSKIHTMTQSGSRLGDRRPDHATGEDDGPARRPVLRDVRPDRGDLQDRPS
jgi:acyl-CoA synthetase (AMP-forming)/AMP-acid ligase II